MGIPLAWKAPGCSLRLALNGGNQLRLPTGGVQRSTLDLQSKFKPRSFQKSGSPYNTRKNIFAFHSFAETSPRFCEVQGLSHFLLGDLCQHRPSAGFFAFKDFFKDINPLPKSSLQHRVKNSETAMAKPGRKRNSDT